MRHPCAVVCAVPSAAGRQICAGAGGEGKHGRDQRKAEEEKQDGAEKTLHSVIVAGLFSGRVREMFCGGELWGISPGIELNQ
jgi:hypothetical protein